MIEIFTIGGYNEVGKNMTALKVDNEIVILDMGLHVEKIVPFDEDEQEGFNASDMLRIGAIPDDSVLKGQGEVKAIVISHAHLDHLGAVPYLAGKYNCSVIGTAYTIEVLRAILKDKGIHILNPLKVLDGGKSLKISNNIKIEFLSITHSTLQTVMIIVHTKYGVVIYANDFKFDNHPVIGVKPNYNRLRELGKKGVIGLIVDCTRAERDEKTPSEKVAREMLRDVLMGTSNRGNAIVVTTFSSHIARLKSIAEFGRKINRKIVFLGRSLNKYVSAAEKLNLVKFKGVEVIGFKGKIKNKLSYIEKDGRGRYLIVCTGNQGEPKSVLSRLVNDEMPFRFLKDDHVIFSCATIPSETNIKNRAIIESKLKNKYVRLFKDIHVSGHASKEDHRDLISMINPKNVIPAHGDSVKLNALGNLAKEMGYKEGKNLHIVSNGKKIII